MKANDEHLEATVPPRRYGTAVIGVSLLLLVVMGFANAWCHPRTRFIREVKLVKLGEREATVEARMKASGASILSIRSSPSVGKGVTRFLYESKPPNWWHLFCPEFPFIEPLYQWKRILSQTDPLPTKIVVIQFEDGKAVILLDGGPRRPLSL